MDFQQFWRIYESSFPKEERRSRGAQEKLMQNEGYKVESCYIAGEISGFICYWELSDFIFIEHLAIKNGLRGLGYGSKMLRHFLSAHGGQKNPPRVLLEVGLPPTVERTGGLSSMKSWAFT